MSVFFFIGGGGLIPNIPSLKSFVEPEGYTNARINKKNFKLQNFRRHHCVNSLTYFSYNNFPKIIKIGKKKICIYYLIYSSLFFFLKKFREIEVFDVTIQKLYLQL